MADTQTHVHTHTHAHTRIKKKKKWHTSHEAHRFSGCLCVLCVKMKLSEYKPEEVGTCHRGPASFFLFFSFLISLHALPWIFPFSAPAALTYLPNPTAIKLVKPPFVTCFHTCTRMTQSHHGKSPEPEQAGKLWKTRIQFGTYGA